MPSRKKETAEAAEPSKTKRAKEELVKKETER